MTFCGNLILHMGGVWERMIGVSRKILDSMLLREGSKNLTHEVLTTLLSEVTAIVNARPLVPVSTDPESPCVLCPAMLLTHKTNQDNVSFPTFGKKDMLKSQWKHTQFLAEEFWNRWRNEYLNRLQTRQNGPVKTYNITLKLAEYVVSKCSPEMLLMGYTTYSDEDLYLSLNDTLFVTSVTLSEALTILGVCYEISGDKDAAYQCYDDALQCDGYVSPSAEARISNHLEMVYDPLV
ncbi:Hypothetical predicted protein [Mytilus galloprovincialis]|uniref:DUF5641 domain-containing protein n=1 Tax=Mytilus galloprovincialis TaxID=29158 RepID=A0A8B6CC50_MYTGA|nr:Hypothetical predicted protein [Mytilus galloprovincialis]